MKKEDYFCLFNFILSFLMLFFFYFPRNRYRIDIGLATFYILILTVGFIILWRIIRQYDIEMSALIAIEAGILLHFSGGIVIFGSRLYDAFLFGIRYDKYVHFANLFGAAIFAHSFLEKNLKVDLGKYKAVLLMLALMGAGAIIEVIEYVSLETLLLDGEELLIPAEMLYDNNLQDMVANLLGAACGLSIFNIPWPSSSAKKSSSLR